MTGKLKDEGCNYRRQLKVVILLMIFSVIPFSAIKAQTISQNIISEKISLAALFGNGSESLSKENRTIGNAEHPEKSDCQSRMFLGCPTASFTDLPNVTDVRRPEGLAMADFNGDGKLDMVSSGTGNANQIAVRFGNNNAAGSFQPAVYYTAGTSPGPIAVGDFDGINGLDLAVANSSTASRTRLAILLNQGNGTFSEVTATQCLNNDPRCPGGADQILNVAVGKIDNNSSLDLVVSDENSDVVRIYFGSGNGTFSSPTVIDFPNNVGGGSQFVTLADMDSDGDQDLVVGLGNIGGRVQIKYNPGNGVFPSGQAAVDIGFTVGLKSIAIADFDRNGRLDFATANKNVTSTVTLPSASIKLQNNSGGFIDAAGSPYNLETFRPNSITTGDFNLDGNLDLATANSTSGSGDGFSILLGNSNGSFGAPSTSTITGANPYLVIAKDVTGDRRPDLILTDGVNSGVGIGLRQNACLAVVPSYQFDFDGDGKSDISVFRPSNAAWYLNQSLNGFTGINFGIATDKIVPADYDGDGKTDVAVYRNGTWYLQRSSLGFTGIQFGDGSDIPVPADYDGDGRADLAVFRPGNGTWYLLRSTQGFVGIQFGQSGDKSVAADYDGDGKADIAVNRQGFWYIQRSLLGFFSIQFGDANDKLVPADYDGDGRADVAVFRPSNGTWYLQQSTDGFAGTAFGLGTDLPTPADYDGDGKTDVAVFRNGSWYLRRTTAGFTGVQFGAASDQPIPNAFVR